MGMLTRAVRGLAVRADSIQVRIGLIVAGVMLIIGLVLLGIAAIAVNQASQQILQERASVARLLAVHLDEIVERQLTVLAATASLEVMGPASDDLAAKERLLSLAFFREDSLLQAVYLVDAAGHTLVHYPPEQLPPRDWLADPAVRQVLKTGQPEVADLPTLIPGSPPLLSLAAPVADSGRFLIGLLNLGHHHILADLKSQAYGRSGYVDMLASDGTVVASTRRDHILKKNDHHLQIAALLKQEKNIALGLPDASHPGRQDVVALAPAPLSGLTIVIEQDKAEFLQPVRAMPRRFLGAGLIMMALTLIPAVVANRTLVRPIRRLVGASQGIARGDLSTAVPAAGGGELRTLASSLEGMRQQLQERLESLSQRNRELSALFAVDRAVAGDLPLDEVLNEAVAEAMRALDADGGAALLLTEADILEVRAHRGLSAEFVEATRHIKLGEGLSGQAARLRHPVAMDMAHYPTGRLGLAVAREGLQAMASAPILVGEQLQGVLNVGRRRPTPFTNQDLALLSSVASQLAVSYERVRLMRTLEARAERRAAINRITAIIASSLDMREIYQALAAEMPALIDFNRMSVALLTEQGDKLELIGVSQEATVELPAGLLIKPGDTVLSQVIASGQPLLRADLEQQGSHPVDEVLLRAGIRSDIVIPLRAKGQILGTLNLGSRQVARYSEADLEVLQPVADQLALAVEHSRLFARVEAAKREWETTFDAMSDGVSIHTPDYRILRANQALARLLGTTPLALVGQTCYQVFHRLGQSLPQCPVRRCLEGGEPSAQVVIQEPSLGGRWLHLHADPLRDEQGNIVGVVHIVRDVTAERQHQENLAHLHHLSEVLATTLDLDTVLSLALREISAAVPDTTIAIALMDEWGQCVSVAAASGPSARAVKGVSLPLSRLPEEVRHLVFEQRQPWIVADASLAPPVLTELPGFTKHRSFVALPLFAGEHSQGVLALISDRDEPLSAEEIALLQTYAASVALAIDNARLYGLTDARLRQRVKELEGLTAMLGAASRGLELDAVLEDALKQAVAALEVDGAGVILLDESGQRGVVRAIYQQSGPSPRQAAGLTLEVAAFPLLQEGLHQPVVIEDTHTLPEGPQRELALRSAARSALVVPLRAGGKTLGTLQFTTHSAPRHYPPEAVALAQAMASHLSSIVENARLHQDTERERSTLRSIISSMAEGLLVVDAQGKVAYCNPAVEEMLGVNAANFLGQPLSCFQGYLQLRVADSTALASLERAMEELDHKPKLHFEVLGPTRREIEATLFPIEGDSTRLGTGVLLRDVTREREVDRMKSDFISMASHELRTPMTSIYGFAELLLKSQRVSAEEQEWLGWIYRESQRLTAILDDMLNISRIESGRLSLQLKPLALEPVVSGLVSQFSPHYPSHSLTTEIPGDLPLITADEEKLAQVLYNLISNAVNYSPQGGPVVVSARWERTRGEVVVSVADRGMGIPEQEIPRLFTRFHRVRRPEMEGIRGTGLGLYIVKSLMEMMGGRVWVESQLNQGSTFFITLPVAEASD